MHGKISKGKYQLPLTIVRFSHIEKKQTYKTIVYLLRLLLYFTHLLTIEALVGKHISHFINMDVIKHYLLHMSS